MLSFAEYRERIERGGGFTNLLLKKLVDRWFWLNNELLGNYRQLRRLFSMGFEQKQGVNPSFIKGITDLFEKQKLIKVSQLFTYDEQLLSGNPTLVWTVNRTDIVTLESDIEKRKLGDGIAGGLTPYSYLSGVGGFYAATLDKNIKKIELAPKLFTVKTLYPRDLVIARDTVLGVIENKVVAVSKKGVIKTLADPFIAYPHSIALNRDKTQAVITNSGTDTLLIFDVKSLEVVRRWHAYDHGFNLNISPNQHRLVQFNDQQNLNIPSGFKSLKINRRHPESIVSGYQTTHMNASIFHPQRPEYLLVSIFATKELNSSGRLLPQQRADGKIIAIDLNGNHTDVIRGLNNPHDLTYLGQQIYMLTNTSSEEVHFYQETSFLQWKKLGALVFDDDLRKTNFTKHAWLIAATVTKSSNPDTTYLAVKDGKRQVVHILSFNFNEHIFKRCCVDFPRAWGIQKVWFLE